MSNTLKITLPKRERILLIDPTVEELRGFASADTTTGVAD